MSDDHSKQLAELKELDELDQFNPHYVRGESVDQLIKAHELTYMDQLLAMQGEQGLVEDNIKDLSEFDEKIQESACHHAFEQKKTNDPNYQKKNNIDDALIRPMIIANTILVKKQEVLTLKWKLEYERKIIDQLRRFKQACPKDSLVKRLLAKI